MILRKHICLLGTAVLVLVSNVSGQRVWEGCILFAAAALLCIGYLTRRLIGLRGAYLGTLFEGSDFSRLLVPEHGAVACVNFAVLPGDKLSVKHAPLATYVAVLRNSSWTVEG